MKYRKTTLWLKIIHGGGGNSLITNNLTRYTEILDNGLGAVEVEEIPETPENEEYLASLGLTSAVRDNDLPNGTKYTILAYKKTGNSYTFDKKQTFTVGQNSNIKLNHGQNYTLILISKGTSTSPNIYNEKDINNVNFSNSEENVKVIYQRIDNFIPNGKINNKINVKLKYKTSDIRIVLDASNILGGNIGKNITHIENPKISYRKWGKFYLKNTQVIDITTATKNINSLGRLNTTIVSSDFIKYLKVENETNATFSMRFKTEYMKEIQNVNFALKNLKSGYRYTFRVKLKNCGAYLGKNKTDWRQFMCYNLGVKDFSHSPFKPDYAIRGDMFTWDGQKVSISGNAPFQTSERGPMTSTAWTHSNPCPSGWRVPTIEEWKAVFSNNQRSRIGDFKGGEGDSGVRLGDNLVLPATCYLDYVKSGKAWYHSHLTCNNRIFYWSSSVIRDIKRAFPYKYYNIKYYSDNDFVRQAEYPMMGQSVRCIKN